MNTWNLDFGTVKHWDDFNLEHENVRMKMEYDSASTTPVKVDYINDDGKIIGTSLSIELDVKKVQSPYGNVEICGDIYCFTDEQIMLIESVMSYWKCQIDSKTQTKYSAVIHLGLVLHYDAGTHTFILSDLEINRETAITMKIKEYELTTKMATNLITTTCEQWEASFENYQDDYQLYRICGHMFLLNDYQANYIDSI